LAQGVRRVEGGSGSAAEGSGAGEREAEAAGERVELEEAGVEGHRLGKLLSPERRRCGEPCAASAWDERAAGAPGGETAPRHATLWADTARRRN
jgi:hypothetical protein